MIKQNGYFENLLVFQNSLSLQFRTQFIAYMDKLTRAWVLHKAQISVDKYREIWCIISTA